MKKKKIEESPVKVSVRFLYDFIFEKCFLVLFQKRKLVLWFFVVLLLSSCGSFSEVSRAEKLRENQRTVENEILYTWPRYSFEDRLYRFEKEDRLNEKENFPNLYYVVSYGSGKENRISFIEERTFQKVNQKWVLEYNGTEVSKAKVYLANGKLKQTHYYEKGSHIRGEHWGVFGEKKFLIEFSYSKKGRIEKYFDPENGLVQYTILFDLHQRPSRYVYYKNGELEALLDYEYDEKSRLNKQLYKDSAGKLSREILHRYNTEGKLKSSEIYEGTKSIAKTLYDEEARKISIQEYHSGRQALFRYDDKGIDERWLDERNRLRTWKQYNSHDLLYKEHFYDDKEREILAFHHIYDEQKRRLQTETYKNEKLHEIHQYEKGLLRKTEIFSPDSETDSDKKKNNKIASVFYEYNDQALKTRKTERDSENHVVAEWTYTYDEKNRLSLEQFFPKKKKGKKNIKDKEVQAFSYLYGKNGKLRRKKFFENRVLKKIFYYDSKKRVFKIEVGEKKIEESFVRRFNKQDQLVQENHLNHLGQIEQSVFFGYDQEGRRVQEDAYDGRKQYIGSIRYIYNSRGDLIRREFYNYQKKLHQVVDYDIGGNPIRSTQVPQD